MQVPRFSPRISLIEMAPCAAPHSGCLGRSALPCPCPALFVTDRQTPLLLLYIRLTNKELENELKLNNLLFEQDMMQIENEMD